MTSQLQDEPRATVRILRFDLTQRCAHWANALLFGILMATALPLYFGSLAGIIGKRHLIAEIHLWAGIALPVPIVISYRTVGGPDETGHPALQSLDQGRDPLAEEPGHAPIVLDNSTRVRSSTPSSSVGAIVVMLATGSIMQWFGHFPVSWRTGPPSSRRLRPRHLPGGVGTRRLRPHPPRGPPVDGQRLGHRAWAARHVAGVVGGGEGSGGAWISG